MSALLFANTFGPRPVRIIAGLAALAFGIYTGGLKSLFSFSGMGGEGGISALKGLAPILGAVSSVATFLQGKGKGKHKKKREYDPEKVRRQSVVLAQTVITAVMNFPGLRDKINENRDSRVSQDTVLCQAAQESSYVTLAAKKGGFISSVMGAKGEVGLLQIKPSTASSLGLGTFSVDQLKDVATNVKAATRHLGNLSDTFGGDLRQALGAYKQGEAGVINKGLSVASQEYADEILGCVKELEGM
jgi:hypothetical protein